MNSQLISNAEAKMQRALAFFEEELLTIRSGRAQVGLVDGLKVGAYGQTMQLKQLATVTTPDARTIMIQPWDKALMASIEKAIRETPSLGLNPSNDGNVIRLSVSTLTEERKSQLVKLLSEKLEAAKVSLRNSRHEVMNEAKKMQKNKELTEDELYGLESQLNKVVDRFQQQAEQLFAAKQKEIMAV